MLMGGFSHFVGHISRFFHVLQGTLQLNWIILLSVCFPVVTARTNSSAIVTGDGNVW